MRWGKVGEMRYLPLRSSFYRKDMGMGRMGGGPRYGQLENQDLVSGISATGIILKKEHEELVRVEKSEKRNQLHWLELEKVDLINAATMRC